MNKKSEVRSQKPAWRASGVAAVLFFAVSLASQSADPELSPDQRAAMERISANSLRGHVSFLASDLLEGRDTP